MKKYFLLFNLMFSSFFGTSQWVEGTLASCENPEFNRTVNKWINYSVDVVGVSDLKDSYQDVLLLDAREMEEYLVSHIPGAQYLGHKAPKWNVLDKVPKDTPIVIYCSIGYRSEKIGEQLLARGFTQVRNLYGSIFEWANQGCPLEDPRGKKTNRVHTYNKKWSKWLDNTELEKVY